MLVVGVNEHMDWAAQSDPSIRQKLLEDAYAMGVRAIRLDYAWASFEPNEEQWDWRELDTYIGEASEVGLKVLVMLYWPPAWAAKTGVSKKYSVPRDPIEFGRACGTLAARYHDDLAGVEMWNEPDLDGFWEGTVNEFVNLLAGAYPVAKSLSPYTTFLAAAPTYLGLASNWFAECFATGSYNQEITHDVQAIHPYMSPSDLPPTAPASEWSIHGIAELQELRADNDDYSPLWVTEFGWSTHANVGNEANYKRGVTLEQQAAFTAVGLAMFALYGIEQAYIYTDMDMPGSDAQEANFGLRYSDTNPKPVVGVLTALLADREPEPPDPTEPPTDPNLDEIAQRVSTLEYKLSQLGPALVHAGETVL